MVAFIRSLYLLVLIGLLGGIIFLFWQMEHKQPPISFNEFLTSLDNNEIAEVHFQGGAIRMKDNFGREFTTFAPDVPALVPKLLAKNVVVHGENDRPSPLWNLLSVVLPVFLVMVAWYFLASRQLKKGEDEEAEKDKKFRFAPSTASITFRDVAGVPEAKEELVEIIDFLQRPKKYSKLGAVIPRGILFQGPPGTGKPLLAKAIAGEAGVPFFSISGSDFVEMFVGVGASRVRELFHEAKKHTPCIIFIDEIDAVGRHRGAGLGGGHDEREQTLNQLLVEMDGFEANEGVIIVSATNRPDVLDPALLRPGRFDRQVVVPAPDVKGREAILQVHAQKVPLAEEIDWKIIARGTPGFTGADLENMVNEAALLAARNGQHTVTMSDLEKAKDKVMMGAERRSMIITEKEKEITAYHEAGHALVAKLLPGTDPLHKVTIIPRGRALGLTQQLPTEDKYTHAKSYLLNNICVLLGGRVAEDLIFNEITTGSGNDIERASDLARKMVCEWGMSETLGPLTFGKKEEQIFLGREISQHRDYSEDTAIKIDREVREIVVNANAKVVGLLTEHLIDLKSIAQALLEKETLVLEDVEALMRKNQAEQVAG